MRHVDRGFVGLAVVNALCGMGLGIWMSRANDYTLVPLHAHLNLIGWVTFAVFGLAYRTGIAKDDGWAAVHFWVSAAAIATFSLGIAVALLFGRSGPVYAGAALMIASMLLFGLNVARAAASPAGRRDPRAKIGGPARRRPGLGDSVPAAAAWRAAGRGAVRLHR